MVIDDINKYKKKKLSGFIEILQVTKELDDLLKYYDAENIQPDEEQTKKLLSKFDSVNHEYCKLVEKSGYYTEATIYNTH